MISRLKIHIETFLSCKMSSNILISCYLNLKINYIKKIKYQNSWINRLTNKLFLLQKYAILKEPSLFLSPCAYCIFFFFLKGCAYTVINWILSNKNSHKLIEYNREGISSSFDRFYLFLYKKGSKSFSKGSRPFSLSPYMAPLVFLPYSPSVSFSL